MTNLINKEKINSYFDKPLFLGLSFFIFFLPIYNSLCSIGIGLLIFSYLIKILFLGEPFRKPFLIFPILVFVCVCAFSIFFSPSVSSSLVGLRKLILYVSIYIATVSSINSERRLKFILFLVLLSAVTVSIDGIYQVLTGKDWFSGRLLMEYPHRGIFRVTASFHQAGSLGIFMASVIPCFWYSTFFMFRGKKKILLIFTGVLMTAILISSLAPGAALGVLSSFIFLSIVRKELRLAALSLGISAFGFLLLPVSITSWPAGSLFDTFFGRLKMWRVALDIIGRSPIFGSGINTFSEFYAMFCKPGDPFYGQGAPYAHNMYIQMTAEVGLIGLAVFAWILISLFKKSFAIYSSKRREGLLMFALLGSLVSYLIFGLLESAFYTSHGALTFWILLSLIASLHTNFNLRNFKWL